MHFTYAIRVWKEKSLSPPQIPFLLFSIRKDLDNIANWRVISQTVQKDTS